MAQRNPAVSGSSKTSAEPPDTDITMSSPWRRRAGGGAIELLLAPETQSIPEGYSYEYRYRGYVGHATASRWPRRAGPVPGGAAT